MSRLSEIEAHLANMASGALPDRPLELLTHDVEYLLQLVREQPQQAPARGDALLTQAAELLEQAHTLYVGAGDQGDAEAWCRRVVPFMGTLADVLAAQPPARPTELTPHGQFHVVGGHVMPFDGGSCLLCLPTEPSAAAIAAAEQAYIKAPNGISHSARRLVALCAAYAVDFGPPPPPPETP